MFLSTLQQLQENMELLSIESCISSDEYTGYLLHVNEEYICMSLYTGEGLYDGNGLFETDSLEEIYWGNRPHKAIQKLITQKCTEVSIKPICCDTFIEAILKLADVYGALEIYNDASSATFDIATILANDEEWLKLSCYGTKNTLSQYQKLMSISTIDCVIADTIYLNNIVSLHQD